MFLLFQTQDNCIKVQYSIRLFFVPYIPAFFLFLLSHICLFLLLQSPLLPHPHICTPDSFLAELTASQPISTSLTSRHLHKQQGARLSTHQASVIKMWAGGSMRVCECDYVRERNQTYLIFHFRYFPLPQTLTMFTLVTVLIWIPQTTQCHTCT